MNSESNPTAKDDDVPAQHPRPEKRPAARQTQPAAQSCRAVITRADLHIEPSEKTVALQRWSKPRDVQRAALHGPSESGRRMIGIGRTQVPPMPVNRGRGGKPPRALSNTERNRVRPWHTSSVTQTQPHALIMQAERAYLNSPRADRSSAEVAVAWVPASGTSWVRPGTRKRSICQIIDDSRRTSRYRAPARTGSACGAEADGYGWRRALKPRGACALDSSREQICSWRLSRRSSGRGRIALK